MQIFGMHLIQEKSSTLSYGKSYFSQKCVGVVVEKFLCFIKYVHICSTYIVKDFFFVNMNEEVPFILTVLLLTLE